MNDEEKEAIQVYKNLLNYLENDDEEECVIVDDKKYFKIVLNLIEKQQAKIDKALEFIDEHRYTDDNGCGYEWEGIDDIDELVSILKGE